MDVQRQLEPSLARLLADPAVDRYSGETTSETTRFELRVVVTCLFLEGVKCSLHKT